MSIEAHWRLDLRPKAKTKSKLDLLGGSLRSFKFIVTLDVVSATDGVIKLKGKQELGRTLGTYHYDVTFKDGHFLANYHTDKDKGVFEVRKN